MEMFVLSYANVLYIYPKLCLQVGSASWPKTYLTNQYVILRYCSPNLCKRNYLYGNLPFYKIQVNHFMAWDESSGAKIIPKCILRPDAILSFKTFLSFINRLLEGDGTPLQCSCLENPRQDGAWWAAISGRTESDTTEAT